MWSNVIIASLVMASFSLIIGLILTLASIYFYKEEDTRVIEIQKRLPGYNCGACGFVNCERLSKAILSGEARGKDACKVISKDLQEKLIDYCATIVDDNNNKIILK